MSAFVISDSWKIAAGRAILSAVIVGGLGFLAVWSQTDDLKTLIIAGLTPALTTLGMRLGVEGYADRQRN